MLTASSIQCFSLRDDATTTLYVDPAHTQFDTWFSFLSYSFRFVCRSLGRRVRETLEIPRIRSFSSVGRRLGGVESGRNDSSVFKGGVYWSSPTTTRENRWPLTTAMVFVEKPFADWCRHGSSPNNTPSTSTKSLWASIGFLCVWFILIVRLGRFLLWAESVFLVCVV